MSYTVFLILILIVAIALILIVMVQNPKGGGLSSSFGGGGAQSLGGVQNTNNFLDRTTWTLAVAMFVLILLSNFAIPRSGDNNFKLDNTLDGVKTSTPVTPAPTTTNTNDSLKK
ncbi:MAG: preprotein translocase subunit SecG [Polaribacter sp.]